MAECYLHNQYPKIANEDLNISLKFYIEAGRLTDLHEKYGVVEEDDGRVTIDTNIKYNRPPANTIWICLPDEDSKINKIKTCSTSLPVGEKGLCVIWSDKRGLTSSIYYWYGETLTGEWTSVDAFLYNQDYVWVKIASAWDGTFGKWLYYYSSTTGHVIDTDEKQAILGGGDSRFLSKSEECIGAYDYIEINNCYANSDVTIGLLRISDQQMETWGINNFMPGALTIKASEFKNADEDEGINFRMKIPKPINEGEASSSNFANPYLPFRLGVFVGSLNIPSETIIQFSSIKCFRDLTGENAVLNNFYTENKEIGGIYRP